MRKVNEQLREIVAETFVDLKDPRIGFVTVTGVECAPDLRHAVVFYSVLGTPEEAEATAVALASAGRKIQAAIATEVRLKYTPVLEFRIDPVDRARREDLEDPARHTGQGREGNRVTGLNQDLRMAAAALQAATRILVTGHIRPDGDALGSMLALTIAARHAGKQAVATFGEPFLVPAHFSYLDTEWLLPPDSDFGEIDIFVACDAAAPDRLGTVAPLADRAGTVLVIDHHISNSGFGDLTVIDPGAAATAELVFDLIAEVGWKVTEAVATALYTGLVTDTGRFQYSSTSPHVHRIVAQLLETGVRPDMIGQRLYERSPFGYLTVAGAVLSRAKLDVEHSLVWSTLRISDLEEAGVGHEDVEPLIDLVRLAEEAQVACLVREIEPGLTKGSLRSRGQVDVAAVAAALGGGGHHNASGFTFVGSHEEAIEHVRRQL